MSMRFPRWMWTLAALAAIVAFFLLANGHGVYSETSPPHVARRLLGPEAAAFHDPLGISLQVLLRKTYSIVAFTLVSYLVMRATRIGRDEAFKIVLFGAAFSTMIEYAQALRHSHEGLEWQVIDIACGALGGALATLFIRRKTTA